MRITHRSTSAEARQFIGTVESAREIMHWLDGVGEATWAPLDESGYAGADTDLTKGVALDVMGTLGFQDVRKGDWLVKDSRGVIAYDDENFVHYYYEGD